MRPARRFRRPAENLTRLQPQRSQRGVLKAVANRTPSRSAGRRTEHASGVRSPILNARLSWRSKIYFSSEVAAKIDIVDQDHRRATAQPQEYRCRSSAGNFYLRYRCFWLWEIDVDSRRSLSKSCTGERPGVGPGSRSL